jgi:cell division protease FtsH
MVKNLILWAVIAVVLMSVFNNFSPRSSSPTTLSYSEFIDEVKGGNVQRVQIDERTLTGETASGEHFTTYTPPDDPQMINDLLANKVEI